MLYFYNDPRVLYDEQSTVLVTGASNGECNYLYMAQLIDQGADIISYHYRSPDITIKKC